MGRYKSRRQVAADNHAVAYVKMRRALVEIRQILGMGERAKIKDVVDGVRNLVEKDKKDERPDSDSE
jgi:hypothetical protein